MKKEFKKLSMAALFAGALLGSSLMGANGNLSLVSSGTGDLDNMTLKAYNTIKAADIIFIMKGKPGKFESLIKGKPIYDAGHAMFLKHGNKRSKKSPEQIAKIENEYRNIIRDAVKKGRNVVIIDNGDPTIYGPHTGYIHEFKDLDPKIIPGLSSFNAANAALQRSVIGGVKNAHGVTLTIGNTDNELIKKLAGTRSTLVFFMDREFKEFMSHLRGIYKKGTSIAIVVDAGSSKKEKVYKGTLETIENIVGEEKIPFNHLVYVGDFLDKK